MQGKRPVDIPQAAGAPRVAPRAQAPLIPMSDLQTGPEIAGTSHLTNDLRRYVSPLVRQYVEKRPGQTNPATSTTDSPVLDVDMMEEDRLACQQLVTGMRRSPNGDHPMLGGNDDVTGDDWESLDAKDFLMGEADPNNPVPTGKQVALQQPDLASVNRQTDTSAGQR